jgi:predicted DNA-binding mobile mystery protein A
MARTVPGARTRPTARRALDRRFDGLRPLVQAATAPRGGWVRALREALGMSAAELGGRMDTSETAVLKMEGSERDRRVRIDTLERAADALECDLVYALVPRRSLEEMTESRALARARALLGAVDHSMMLEDQRVAPSAAEEQLRELADTLRERPGLWRDD